VEYLNAYILCFLQVTFSALTLMVLHGLRKQIGRAPFYLAVGTLLVFAHFINSADLQLSTGISGLSINVATSLLLSPFIMAMLIVYTLDGTIEAQRLTIGAIAVSGTFFFLANITANQCDWYGFELSNSEFAKALQQLLNRSRQDVAAALGAIIIDLLVLPVTFQFFRNRRFSTFLAVTLSLVLTQVVDSFVYSLISDAWSDDFWENMQRLYLSRAFTMVWLGILTTLYLNMNEEDLAQHQEKNPLDFLKAIVNSYSRKKIIQSYAHEWEGRFELFVENSQDLILLVGKDGRIFDGNKIAVQYLGQEISELQKMYLTDLVIYRRNNIPEYLKQVSQESKKWERVWWNLVKNEGEPLQQEWIIKDYKDRIISLEFSINLVEMGDKFALLTGRNSTTRHKLAHERQELMHQLTHSQRLESVGRLAGGIAHDFNNLLHSIQGSLDSIAKNPHEEKKKALENNIVNAVTKASALTGQLLGFAQKGKYAVKKVDLSQILTSAHALFEPMARKTLKSRLILHPEPIYVKADATQLEQVLLNLLINARDALENCENAKIFFRLELASDYTPGWHLAVKEASPEHFACVRVKDNGSGIKPENLKTIFDPFFTTKEVGKGTGMGLAMAYGTINNHSGWIHVESEMGRGTEFFIFLPLHEAKLEFSTTHTQLNITF
jgi:PAS domain S-box-containing protein